MFIVKKLLVLAVTALFVAPVLFLSQAIAEIDETRIPETTEILPQVDTVDYAQIVDARLYDGGQDEEPLQVQKALASPYSTVNLQNLRSEVLEEVIAEKKEEELSETEGGEEAETESDSQLEQDPTNP